MSGISREEVKNMFAEYKLEHNISGCEAVRALGTFTHGDLQSTIFKLKNSAEASERTEKRVTNLDQEDTGKVTILWRERNAVIKYILGSAASIIVALATYFWAQATSLQKTDAKLELTNRYQLAQTLFIKYSVTGDVTAKTEADKIIADLKIK